MNTTEYRPNTRNTRKTVISLHPLDAYTQRRVEAYEREMAEYPLLKPWERFSIWLMVLAACLLAWAGIWMVAVEVWS